MEVVVTGGCSWSDPNYRSTDPVFGGGQGGAKVPEEIFSTSWVEQVDFGTDVKFIHTATSGNSISRSIDDILNILFIEKKVDRVVLGLTEWLRFPLITKCLNVSFSFYVQQKERENKLDTLDNAQRDYGRLCSTFFNDVENLDDWGPDLLTKIMDVNMRKVLTLIEICKARGIKLYIMQVLEGVRPELIGHRFTEWVINHIIESDMWKLISDSKDFTAIGWPFFWEMGGQPAEKLLQKGKGFRREDKIHRISERDAHPNNEGHRIIAEWFNKHV